MELYSDAIKNPCNRIFLFDHAQYQEFAPKNPNCIFYLPLASYVKQFDKVIKTITSEDDKYKSDVSFVGSLYSEKSSYNKVTNLPPYLKGYLEGIMDAQLKVYGYNFVPELITEDICEEFNKCVLMYNFPKKSTSYAITSSFTLAAASLFSLSCLSTSAVCTLSSLRKRITMR